MGKLNDKRNLKLYALEIKTENSILFGAFTKNLTIEMKNNAWNEILTTSNQDAKYLQKVW